MISRVRTDIEHERRAVQADACAAYWEAIASGRSQTEAFDAACARVPRKWDASLKPLTSDGPIILIEDRQ